MAAQLLLNTVIGGGAVVHLSTRPVGQTQSFDVQVGNTVSTCW